MKHLPSAREKPIFKIIKYLLGGLAPCPLSVFRKLINQRAIV
jgi:hypothetical protein